MKTSNPNTTWQNTTHSLANNHPSMSLTLNPVLAANLSTQQVISVLKQYCFLPAYIVQFLTKGMDRCRKCGYSNIVTELERNIAEEQGSRTQGQVHYDILVDGIQRELGVNTTEAKANKETVVFLNGIEGALGHPCAEFAIGTLYALESSAVPELLVVASVINKLRENDQPVVDLQAMTSVQASRQAKWKVGKYSLQDFFTLHILDFEKGHESRLRTNIQADSANMKASTDWPVLFEAGFEHTLQLMDDWWDELSHTTPVK